MVVMRTDEFDYELPKGLIAQEPLERRDASRLMIVDKGSQKITHDYFHNLPKYLRQDDLLVFNDTKVMPARLMGEKMSGGKVEILLLPHPRPLSLIKERGERGEVWEFIGRNIGGAKKLVFEGGLEGKIVQRNMIRFNKFNAELMKIINRIGYTPLPPYIMSRGGGGQPNLKRRYQTVFAKNFGSAAAPTAGFHFDRKLMKRLSDEGIKQEFVTLHVGLGTFAPVRVENIEDHEMHEEYFSINPKTKVKIRNHKLKGKRIMAVGTTSVRVLESDWRKDRTNIFIYPGYKFKNVDAMITNFHLPKSTLLMLVCAFAGKDLIMKAYREAIVKKYRFFSFGDAMMII